MTRQTSILLSFLYLACTLAMIQADFVSKIKLKKTPLIIKCENITDNSDIIWKMEDKVINEQKMFKIDAKNLTLTVDPADDDTSIFNKSITCSPKNSTTPASKFKIFPKPIPTMNPHSVAVEGEKLTLYCHNKNNFYPSIKIKWQFKNQDINDTSRITYKSDDNQIEKSMLIIEKPTLDDAGEWSCRAAYDKNDLNNDDIEVATTTLRVKDKLAALWPFLGICAEVFILCTIILIYEKKRNKSDLEESDTDQSPDTKPASNKDSDVRHRK
ncbi:basigin isoform X2 [Aphidius gifuensis]|uniref:basigin isoform X2 n=1 Tax=Aphidius gifuensis TaxID=684658 RepID=UPI001CDBB0C4|nr:basigin isoform X2 [Aphidius gifuensis]XP_044004192.1 basigin isoform X2 [Aphidius gifuensis]